MVTKYITEILEEVNKDTSKLKNYRESLPLKLLFQYAFIAEKKFDLPEGNIKFRPDSAPIGMTPANFMQEIRSWYVFTRDKVIPKSRKEILFIQLLENIHPSEADILLAIKDQKLTSLYRNITADVVSQHGFIPSQKSHAKT